MGKLSNLHLPTHLVLGSEPAHGTVRTIKRRICSIALIGSISSAFFFLLFPPTRLHHHQPFLSSSRSLFSSSHSLGPIIIKPVEIEYDPQLFGLEAPVEWSKRSLSSSIPWRNPIHWPILLSSSRLLEPPQPLELRVFPRHIKLNSDAPMPSDLIFGMTTTAERVSVLSELWPAWLGAPKEAEEGRPLCVIVLPQEDHEGGSQSRASLLSEKLVEERGLYNIELTTSWLGPSARYESRYFGMLREMNQSAQAANRNPKWFIISDDDTLWTDERMLRRELSKFDPDELWLLGASSEGISQIQQFGNMAFGGAGIIVSRGMCQKMLEIHAECVEETKNVFGGDEMYSLCAARAAGNGKTKETVVTQLNSLHQLDLPGDGTGFLQSGFPFLSLHHLWHGWTDAFARDHQVSFGRPDNALNHLLLLQQAAQLLGGDNFMRRAVYDDGRELITLGYTVTLFDKPLRQTDMGTIEKTWSGDAEYPLRFPTRPRIVETNERGSGGKRTFYLCEIRLSVSNPQSFLLIHRDRWGDYAEVLWDSK